MIARSMLAHRLSQDEIKEICVLAHGKHNDHLKKQLYQLTLTMIVVWLSMRFGR